MNRRLVLLASAALVISSCVGWTVAAGDPPRPDATAVPVTAGHKTSGVNIVQPLVATGSISGRLIDAATGHVISDYQEVPMVAVDRSGQYISGTTAGSNASFTIPHLPPSTSGYVICAWNPDKEVTTHPIYAAQCFPHSYTTGGKPPSSAKSIPLGNGEHVDIGDLALTRGATIRGKVRTPSGRSLPDPTVLLRSLSDPSLIEPADGFEQYGDDGDPADARHAFAAFGLPPSPKGWAVCYHAFAGMSAPLRSTCYGGRKWSGQTVPIKGVKAVKVAAGATKTGIVIGTKHLIVGSITGTVRAPSGTPLAGAFLSVFDAAGRGVGGVTSPSDGHGRYHVNGLTSGLSYRVCAAWERFGKEGETMRAPMCFGEKLWRVGSGGFGPPPSAARTVRVRAPHATTGIDIRLTKAARISGTVVGADTGKPVKAAVYVFDAKGRTVAETPSDHDGHYTFPVVRSPHGGYTVCAETNSFAHHRASAPGCRGGGYWDGSSDPGSGPVSAHYFTLAAGQHKPGVDIVMPLAGTIAGRVTVASGGPGAIGLVVIDRAGNGIGYGWESDSDGRYVIWGLRPSKFGYYVCTTGPRDNYFFACHSTAAGGG